MTDKEILQGIDRLDAELPFDEICVGGKDNWHDIDVHELLYEVKERIKGWHYPSKGEYPTEGETVLVAFQEGGLWYFANAEYHEGGWASVVELGNIVAWQYIVPPKEMDNE